MSDAVAILPARGGSKRIPRKNIRLFEGRPAIGWPIAAARDSGLFARIVVSTDDAEIAAVARDLGAETPFLRAAHLSDDHAGTTEVVRDAVARLGLAPQVPVCCIYPTALFLAPADLAQGRAHLEDGARWVLSVGRYATPIDRAYRLEGGSMIPRQPEMMPKRSQDLEPAFFDAGQFYWAMAATWADATARIWDGAAGVELPAERAVDIDTPEDWTRAEMLARLARRAEG
ncbi:pseudaminic acid cytidylyltransferase [Phaeovulum vinaykumarii]|uniref:N-acylneuraminate cytidylyltransferase n=1 Tax=Phaeovulum vinaykumarii TaxID=407234 RepID=A0A1N7LG28_9RHOB|nr:pseudaminic acid cytidylyltransferase [Phaeovulum vinaykumarii]SIS72775.1 N-acylneuraminate cytidylyltransferase [Phaeovulum vinaykumarii]SOC04507.1 N-acylneuraminate cytidylyltransferase [Phaeovulum vinaykumarii]